MTDPQVHEPIAVPSSASREQVKAAVRQVALALGAIVAAFGLAKTAGVLSVLANLADPISTLIFAAIGLVAFVWGQIKTREATHKASALVDHIDDPSVAVKK